MGVKIFRDGNWSRIKSGIISRRDVMGLDPVRDSALIGYLLVRAPAPCRDSMRKYAAEKYGIDRLPEPQRNTDDPNDPCYEEYVVLREQVVREDDADVLKEAALHSSDHAVAAFAFCRLTGCRFPPGECDAYSYRTFACEALPGMTAEEIRELCRRLLAEGGPLKAAAEECIRN